MGNGYMNRHENLMKLSDIGVQWLYDRGIKFLRSQINSCNAMGHGTHL